MDITTEKKKRKRPSKGMRKHNRRLKQEARKTNVPGSELEQANPLIVAATQNGLIENMSMRPFL